MVISPAVQPPKSGDPITAKWASDLSAAVNSCANPADRVGEVSTPYGKASPAPGRPMLGAAARTPQPFDCILYRAEGDTEDDIYMWLPDLGAYYVVWQSRPLPAAAGQSLGTASNGWVKVCDVTLHAAGYIYLTVHANADGVVDGWRIVETGNPWVNNDGSANGNLPHVLMARYYIAADEEEPPEPGTNNNWPSGRRGLVQCRHGTIVFGGNELLDTENIGDLPGDSLNRYQSDEEEPDPTAAIQLRQFHDVTDVETIAPPGSTTGTTAANLQVLFRKIGEGTEVGGRPKLVYSPAGGIFWITGGDATTNYGTSIKIGSAADGYITISATP